MTHNLHAYMFASLKLQMVEDTYCTYPLGKVYGFCICS